MSEKSLYMRASILDRLLTPSPGRPASLSSRPDQPWGDEKSGGFDLPQTGQRCDHLVE
jgi:hypothetical protein